MMSKTLEKQKTDVQVDTSVSAEIDKVILISIACFAGIIGLWSVACLVSAMVQAGGPIALGIGWFMAISGL